MKKLTVKSNSPLGGCVGVYSIWLALNYLLITKAKNGLLHIITLPSANQSIVSNVQKIINFVMFQIGWFACVAGGATPYHWLGSLAVFLIVIYHLYHARPRSAELTLIVLALLLGLIWENILAASGQLIYQHGIFAPFAAPHWIIAMWALFATTMNVSMRWLKGRWLIGGLLGAIGGPLAFYAGMKLNAVAIPALGPTLLVLGAAWALFMVLLMALSNRFDGYSQEPN